MATMDKEFQALVEYVEHQFLIKVNMALDATWKGKKAQKVKKYVKKKMQDWEALVAFDLECITWGWHLMFQIFTTLPLLQGFLPYFPWMHNKRRH
jgi:hypothetical protein